MSNEEVGSIGELQLDLQVSHIARPSAKMLLRPDAVSICQRGDQNSLNATVVGQHFSGATTMVRLRLDHNDTVVSALLVSRDVTVAVGEGVGVLLNTREAIIERSND